MSSSEHSSGHAGKVAGDDDGWSPRASHSRYFWGLRLHLIATLHGLPVAFAITGAKADERQTPLDLLGADPDLGRRPPRARADR